MVIMRKFLCLLFFLFPIILFGEQKGITTQLPEINVQAVESAIIQDYSLIQKIQKPAPGEIAIDYSKDWFILPAGTYSVIKFNSSSEKLEVINPSLGISETVKNAVNCSPKWIQPALLDNFRKIQLTKQNGFAQMIINAPTDIRDEIAFQIAYLSPQTLNSIDSRIIQDNAEYIYTISQDLKYVQLIEYVDNDNWYTTTKYRVLKDGDSVWVEIPKDAYYWWVVMPKLSDEEPLMNASVYNQFWRRHLYNVADSGYPVLKEILENTKILWDCQSHQWPNFDSLQNPLPFADTMHALQVVGQWTGQTVWGEAKDPRPVQPNQILHDHDGNCGELQDLFNAGARTALMPVYSVSTFPGDHAWDELYWENDDWVTCDVWRWKGPTNVTKNFKYPKKGCIFQWGGDGSIRLVNSHYQPVCTLLVNVVDQNSRPVDGAQVTIFSAPETDPQSTQLYLAAWLYTDQNGILELPLGTNISYGLRADWSGGHGPSVYNQIYPLPWSTNGFIEGGHILMTVPTSGSTPISPQITNQNIPGLDHFKLDINYQIPYRINYGGGYWQYSGFGLDDYQWHNFKSPGYVDFFICDESNYQNFTNGQPLTAYQVSQTSSSGNIEFNLPTDQDYYIIYSNKSKITTSQLLQTKVALSKNDNGVWNTIDEVQSAFDTTTNVAVKEASNSQLLSVYPNPASDYISFTSLNDFDTDVSINIYNNIGTCVMTKNYSNFIQKHSIWLNIQELPSGIYYVNIKSGVNQETAKFIIIR